MTEPNSVGVASEKAGVVIGLAFCRKPVTAAVRAEWIRNSPGRRSSGLGVVAAGAAGAGPGPSRTRTRCWNSIPGGRWSSTYERSRIGSEPVGCT